MIKLPSGVNLKNLIDDLRDFSWEASKVLLYFSKIVKDSHEESNILQNNDIKDPVTLADLKVNDVIIERINEKYKGVDWEILSEENVKLHHSCCDMKSDWIWVLDPLDGTKDFIQGTGNYAMHLALNYKKKPILGIVLIPEIDELWFAYEKTVWCERENGSRLRPNISQKKDLKEMTLITSKNHRNETLKKLIEKINFDQVKIKGSIGCKIASILRGESDIYISLSLPGGSAPKDWDFSAPEIILKAAGGALTNLENQELTYGNSKFEQRGIMIASNNYLNHKNICLEIKEIIKRNNIYPLSS